MILDISVSDRRKVREVGRYSEENKVEKKEGREKNRNISAANLNHTTSHHLDTHTPTHP